MNCKYIVLEGADRTGKATQSQLLTHFFKEKGLKATRVEIPYDDKFTYDLIYKFLKNGVAKRFPSLFQFIQFTNKLGFQIFVLPTLEKENDYIIFDRWKLTSIVYGKATGVSNWLGNFLANQLKDTDLTFVLSTSAKVKECRDDYEKDTSLQTKVRELYDDCVQNDTTGKLILINATGSIEHVHAIIRSIAQSKLNFNKKEV